MTDAIDPFTAIPSYTGTEDARYVFCYILGLRRTVTGDNYDIDLMPAGYIATTNVQSFVAIHRVSNRKVTHTYSNLAIASIGQPSYLAIQLDQSSGCSFNTESGIKVVPNDQFKVGPPTYAILDQYNAVSFSKDLHNITGTCDTLYFYVAEPPPADTEIDSYRIPFKVVFHDPAFVGFLPPGVDPDIKNDGPPPPPPGK